VNCVHTLCKQLAGSSRSDFHWFPNGPSSKLPLPVMDPQRPYGAAICSDCKGQCNGHYMSPVIMRTYKSGSVNIEELAAQVLLPQEEVRMWVGHLETVSTNRERGAVKSAQTRRQKKITDELYIWNVCHGIYQQETAEIEDWIECDLWFHWKCVNIVYVNSVLNNNYYR